MTSSDYWWLAGLAAIVAAVGCVWLALWLDTRDEVEL